MSGLQIINDMDNAQHPSKENQTVTLGLAVRLGMEKFLNPQLLAKGFQITPELPVMVLLAAGKGTRFGQAPKCAQLVNGVPLARHSIEAFRRFSPAPVIGIVGYRHEEVSAALGEDNLYVRTDNPAGGTAFAAYEAFCVTELERDNPVLIITMGDRIVPASIFRKLYETHLAGAREADLTFLTAVYEPPRNRGKGRILRDSDRRVLGIIEQKDIDAIADSKLRQPLDDITEGNCPLYAIRARAFRHYLEDLTNDNAQRQYYLTDIIESIRRDGGEIRTISTQVIDPEYDLLCSDVTRPMDLALLEGIMRSGRAGGTPAAPGVEQALQAIRAERPVGQVAAIAQQIDELGKAATKLGFKPDRPVAIGIAGGRLRIAFMHPDMGRFFGPAWQMPIGAKDAHGREQILVLTQSSDDHQIHLMPTNPEFQEKIGMVSADNACMYPDSTVDDWYSYEGFGTRMAENILLSLGYFTDEEIQRRKESGLPLPPSSLWSRTSMRRPFSLVSNAIASMRTVRTGTLGAKVQSSLGRESFCGLRVVLAGDIPRGGFSSSSAVTVATKNAINSLFDLGVSPDMLVHLSCQAEYGTGVRAGSLDQATEQKGRPGQGTLISSNPRDNYRIIAAYPVPSHRFHMIFPYSVDRDREAWKWSAGTYASEPQSGCQTTTEMRKITGKAAELAAILLRLPLDQDFFKSLENDFIETGLLSLNNRRWVCEVLRKLPLLITQEELRQRIQDNRRWYMEQLTELEKLDVNAAAAKTDATINSLFNGWRDPWLRRTLPNGEIVQEQGVPLRAMVAYLFGEVAKNFYLIHHPEEWITWVTRSQWGDRYFEIEPDRLPEAAKMVNALEWEKGLTGPALMERWLEQVEAKPCDFNRGLTDEALNPENPPEWHLLEGSNFFRGLALIDLVEAMLKRAFGKQSVAVRVNAAGQGDYFQVHVDTTKAKVEAVKDFMNRAFYQRFGLKPEQAFVETHPGGGAVGIRLDRFDQISDLVRALNR
jgi:molybdopterin-guanine dinucleotide biosynthesis protein A